LDKAHYLPELGDIAGLLKMVENHFGKAGVLAVKGILALAVVAIFIFLVRYITSNTPHFSRPPANLTDKASSPDATAPSSREPSSGRPVLLSTPQSLTLNADGSERVFVHVTPDEIKKNYEGHTEDQAKALNAPYLLKWMALSGIVQNSVTNRLGTLVDFTSAETILSGAYSVQLSFGPEWKDKLNILKVGDVLDVVCRISDTTSIGMALDQCEAFEPNDVTNPKK
jgi:hypothetical protein